MASLVTLAGTISAADLNTNFSDKTNTLISAATNGQKDHQWDFEIFDLVTSSSVGTRTFDITAPDDLELRILGFSLYAASTVPFVTVTLSAIDSEQSNASVYMLDQVVSITKQAASGEAIATRDDRQASSTTKIFLKKGITYRLQASSNSATNVDRCHIYLMARSRRRRA